MEYVEPEPERKDARQGSERKDALARPARERRHLKERQRRPGFKTGLDIFSEVRYTARSALVACASIGIPHVEL